MELWRYDDIPENRTKLFRFYEEVYPNSPWLLDNERFDWQTHRNPLLEKANTEIWLLVGDNHDYLGQNIYILYELSIDKKLHRGYCSTNLIVKPGLVGKGHGHRFIQLNESRGGVAYAVGITPASTRAFQKFGWTLVQDGRLYTMVLNPKPVMTFARLSHWKIVIGSIPLRAASFAFRVIAKLRTASKFEGVSFQEISAFDSQHDVLWQKYLSDYAIHFRRTASILNYKYFSRKDVSHKVLLFKKDGVPVGYGVYRLSRNPVSGLRLGRIVDFVADPSLGGKFLRHMFHVMSTQLRKHEIDAVVAVAADARIAAALKANGFFLSRVQPAIIKPEGFDLSDLRTRYLSLWFITLGDSDLDNYW